jgi:hypothetical protein
MMTVHPLAMAGLALAETKRKGSPAPLAREGPVLYRVRRPTNLHIRFRPAQLRDLGNGEGAARGAFSGRRVSGLGWAWWEVIGNGRRRVRSGVGGGESGVVLGADLAGGL